MTPRDEYSRPSRAELLVDGVVHALALVAGLVASALLLAKVASGGDAWMVAAMAIYAAGSGVVRKERLERPTAGR